MGLHVQNRILILLIILGIAAAYSILTINKTEDINLNEDKNLNNIGKALSPNQSNTSENAHTDVNRKSSYHKLKTIVDTPTVKLPYEFSLVGISDLKVNNELVPKNELRVLIKFENELYEHELNDYLFNTDMQLVNIEEHQISILFQHILYTKLVTLPNLLSSNFKDGEKSYSELIQMTPDQIGSRPRLIEHLISLTTTPFIADGKLAKPGLNPALFAQAGFQEDDVLKTINGKSVTIESEFEDIKKKLKTAQTLTFLVMRKGRLITLYLDIPSETLELVRD